VARPTRIDLKPFFQLALGLAVWWLVPTAVRSFIKEGFYELQAPLLVAQSHLEDLQRYWEHRAGFSKDELIATVRDLSRVNGGLVYDRNNLKWLARENRRLETLLDLPPRMEYRTLVTRVARRDLNTWWHRLILRRGKEDGVKVGSPVVVGNGVVGRVLKVHRNTCEVQLVSDRDFRVSVNVDGDERAAVYQGTVNRPFDVPQGIIEHLPADYSYVPADGGAISVFTSGAGGVFPGGLLIGVISGPLQAKEDGLFLLGEVSLHPGLSALEEVSILIPLAPSVEEE
jgi:rod shape-determining protein MreC